ncbi:hypothetical protein PV646_27250 [Streptomyces sp. ID05-26A]|nr:hypothetical protein [Streptomyces sp. ID05-26A]
MDAKNPPTNAVGSSRSDWSRSRQDAFSGSVSWLVRAGVGARGGGDLGRDPGGTGPVRPSGSGSTSPVALGGVERPLWSIVEPGGRPVG